MADDASHNDLTRKQDRIAIGVILAGSAAALAFLVWLIYFRSASTELGDAFSALPAVNATLNALAAVCLVAGFLAIRAKRIKVHLTFMLTALLFSTLFLVSYIIYHAVHGDTKFTGEGAIRITYFVILISHIILSGVMLPMIFTTLYFAARKRFATHRRIARFTLPIWLYVSVTGVVIYFMLRSHS